MRSMLTAEQFAGRVAAGHPGAHPALIRAGASVPASGGDGRTIEYIFSDSTIALDGHRIMTAGWDLTAYTSNPVFCFAHDTDAPPIGRTISTRNTGDQLLGTVEYADQDTYPFADTIFRLTKGGFLNACSVSWEPLEWRPGAGAGRTPGSIDFLRQSLLECSAVPVPALQTALVTARGAGIDVAPVIEWAERVLDGGGMLMVPRDELETLRRTAGAPTQVQVRMPKQTIAEGNPARDLYDVSMVAELLQYLAYAQCSAAWEAEYEGDNSVVPQMLADACHQIGDILIAMTQEETAELLASLAGAGQDTAARKAAFGIHARQILKRFTQQAKTRKGKAVSAANEATMRDKHAAMKRSADDMTTAVGDFGDWIDDVCGSSDGEDPDGDLDDVETENAAQAKAARTRRARAAALRHLHEAE